MRSTINDRPGPGIRLLSFLMLYGAVLWIPRDEWPRFVFVFALAAVLVPFGKQAWKRGARMLLVAVPFIAALGVMIWLFGTLGGVARGKVFVDLMVRTVVTISAAALVWGGAGMREFLAALSQLRAPAIVVSVVTLALQAVTRLGREARDTLDAVRSRSGKRLSRRRRITLVAPLTRHFLLGVIEFHFYQHAALVSRGYAGGPLRMIRPRISCLEWLFPTVYAMAIVVVVAA
ncbi:MAG: hypothetical protein JXA62_02230 [Candidatus Aminicenantes bacterium]|nr:hypothetical protein [Candidatus Aminicenantes bacterium]